MRKELPRFIIIDTIPQIDQVVELVKLSRLNLDFGGVFQPADYFRDCPCVERLTNVVRKKFTQSQPFFTFLQRSVHSRFVVIHIQDVITTAYFVHLEEVKVQAALGYVPLIDTAIVKWKASIS